MRLLELDPQFAQEFPKYKHVKKGGFSVFKGKAGKGMPEEVGVFLRERLQFFRQGMVFNPPSLYRPPTEVPPPASSTSKPLSGARHSQEQDTLCGGVRGGSVRPELEVLCESMPVVEAPTPPSVPPARCV